MSETLLFVSSTMSHDHQRSREIKHHINQLLAELCLIEPNHHPHFQPFNLTINSSFPSIAHEKCLFDDQCPYLTHKQAILHSTTSEEYRKSQQRKKFFTSSPKKSFFTGSTCVTSTPKHSLNLNMSRKPCLTSTPRRTKRQSTNLIPLKRLLYNNKESKHQRHSAKRSIISRYNALNPIEEHPQWI